MKMDGGIKNITGVWLTVMACLCYCYLVSARLPKGKWRLLSLTPIFYVFTMLPLYVSSAFLTAVIGLFNTWLTNFKLLLFAFDQGPLSSDTQLSLPVFVTMAALPFKVKPKTDAPGPKKAKKLPLYLATEIPCTAILISILFEYKESLHPMTLLVVYCCLIFLVIEILLELSSLLLRALLGLELEPPSDEPYLSTSTRDFWGRRWNRTVNDMLRQTIYKPVRSALAPVLGRDWAALPGVLAAFLVSGLMHELIFWYVIRGSPSWEMTMFFVVQGVFVVVESGLKLALAERKWPQVPWYVSGPLTVGFVIGTSFWLFFPPLMRNGADAKVIEEFGNVGEFVKEKLTELWLHIGHRSTY